ncbi:hypothetical protein JCM8115_005253 [Rhodotorula mucilaginosa]
MAVHSPYGVHYGAPVSRSRSEGDAYQRPPLDSLAVTSTSPPCVPKMPPSPRTARPAPSILRNPLSPEEQQRKAHHHHSPPSILKALPGRRRASVVVEVVHSPPPPDFDGLDHNGDSSGIDDANSLNRISTRDLSSSETSAAAIPAASSSSSLGPSPPAADTELSSRSLSPMSIPGARGRSETRTSTASNPSSYGGESAGRGSAFSPGASSVMTDSSAGSASSVKFAPLPPGRRAQRSHSLSIGVASRAKMIQAQGGTPNTRTARYAGPQLWYEGGALPEDVYTWKDAQKGLQKLFKRGEKGKPSEKGKEVAAAPDRDSAPRPARGRSASSSSMTSSSDPEDARRMEREAKGKVREIEHIEEVDDEDADDLAAVPLNNGAEADVEDNLVKVASPAGPAPAPYSGLSEDDDDEEDDDEEDDEDGAGTSTSDLPSPRTPPESGLQLSGVSRRSDGDLDVERRRVSKGKGKAIDDAEHGEVRVAS